MKLPILPIALFLTIALQSPLQAAVPPAAADRAVADERHEMAKAFVLGDISGLGARYTKERPGSLAPQAYDCLQGMILPKNCPEARRLFESACQADETFALARLAYAQSFETRTPKKALKLLEEAWQLRPTDPDIARALGERALAKDDISTVQDICTKLTRWGQGGQAECVKRYLLGRLAMKRQQWDAAYSSFTLALGALPSDAAAAEWWVRLAVAKGKIAEAAKLIDSRSDDPFVQAKLMSAFADSLNVLARRELIPTAAPLGADPTAWRHILVDSAGQAREQVPYGVAWDVSRLGIWVDVADGHYVDAWSRFERRVPGEIAHLSESATAFRYADLRQSIEASDQSATPSNLRELAENMAKVGWTAEALQVARRVSYGMEPKYDDALMTERLAAHQAYLGDLHAKFSVRSGRSLGSPPRVDNILNVQQVEKSKHPSSASASQDPVIRYFRQHQQYLCWITSPWSHRAYRLMAIYSDKPQYTIRHGVLSATVNVVIGEDIMPARGDAAEDPGMIDRKLRDHCHVSVGYDSLLNDLFIQQADTKARRRLDAYLKLRRDGDKGRTDKKAFSPDTLAAMAQNLFDDKGIGACAISRDALPSSAECSDFRRDAIVALVDQRVKREACRLGFQSKWSVWPGRSALHADLYALAYGEWPRLALYSAYRAAIGGEKSQRKLINRIAKSAAKHSALAKGPHLLLQMHLLTDEQIRDLALQEFSKVD